MSGHVGCSHPLPPDVPAPEPIGCAGLIEEAVRAYWPIVTLIGLVVAFSWFALQGVLSTPPGIR